MHSVMIQLDLFIAHYVTMDSMEMDMIALVCMLTSFPLVLELFYNLKLCGFYIYILLLSDIDECQLGTYNCSQYTECKNTIGSYNCTCMTGFSGNGINCTGFDIMPNNL